jgi:hypothetical protein
VNGLPFQAFDGLARTLPRCGIGAAVFFSRALLYEVFYASSPWRTGAVSYYFYSVWVMAGDPRRRGNSAIIRA